MTKKEDKRDRNIIAVFYFLIFIFFIANVNAECVGLHSGSFINENVILCNGTYYLNKDITIIKDNIIVDCNNANIVGDKTNIGFLIENSINTTIKNCTLKHFLIGIHASKSTSINLTGNTLQNNSIGIKLDNVNNAFIDNTFINNNENILKTYNCVKDNFCPNECNGNDADCIETLEQDSDKKDGKVIEKISVEKNASEKINIKNTVTKNILSEIPIRKFDYEHAVKNVELTKTIETKNNKTVYEIIVKANKDIKGIVIYEYFPKETLENANLIKSEYDFEIIEEDPLIKFRIDGELKNGSEQTINYEADKIIVGKNPISIITIETKGTFIKWLLALSVILYSIFIFVNWRLKTKYKSLVDFIKSYSKRYKDAKVKLLRVGWQEYQIDEAIALIKEEKLSNNFMKSFKFIRSFFVEITFIAYISIFGFPNLNMKILPSEIITVIFFGVVNIILALLIIHKGIALYRYNIKYH